MRRLLKTIDTALRGGFTTRADLRRGRVGVNVDTLVAAGLVLGLIYGLFMGLYGATRPDNPTIAQLLSTTIKVPLLFLLTLAVTFPSLYVFSALAGSRLRFIETLRLLLIGMLVGVALLASFGPVTGFFTLSTDSYAFMIVLNVAFFAAGGVVALVFTYRAISTVVEPDPGDENLARENVEPQPAEGDDDAGAADSDTADSNATAARAPSEPPRPAPHPRWSPQARAAGSSALRARLIFFAWAIIYGGVGAQMGWILRPFIGSPDLKFEFFRTRQSDFFEGLLNALQDLF